MVSANEVPPGQREYQLDHFNETKQPLYYGIYSMLLFLGLVSTAMRFWSRKIVNLNYGPDDFACGVATIFFIGVFVCNFQSTVVGKGKHDIAVTPAENLSQAKNQFAANLFYTITWPSIKISILLLYRRIFVKRWFIILNWLLLAVLGIYIVSTVIVDIFSCNPIDKTWHPEKDGRCINSRALYQSTAGANVSIDFVILLMPMPLIWSLQTTLRQKLGLTAIFGIGFISCLSSIMRIVETAKADDNDVGWTAVTPNLWTANELATSLMCASLPCTLPVLYKSRASILRAVSFLQYSRQPVAEGSIEPSTSSHPSNQKLFRLREHVVDPSSVTSHTGPAGMSWLTPQNKNAIINTDARAVDRFHSLPDQERGVPENAIGVEHEVKWDEDGKDSTGSFK